jgi:hypothetical protein
MGAFRSEHLHGVVSRRELLDAGVGRRAIQHRIAAGRLFVRYRGVYAVGRPDLTPDGERRAIVLACGPDAVLSHRSAAGAWGLRPDGGTRWEITIPGARRTVAPVRLYRHPLADHKRAEVAGVPVTSVARTLLDLSAVVEAHHLRRAVERAVDRDLFHLPELERVMNEHPRRPGSPKPRPQVNRHADGREPDFTWPGHPLIVEVDSWRHHRNRRAFVTDRAKDRTALRAGRITARFTDVEIARDPAAVAAELLALLAHP